MARGHIGGSRRLQLDPSAFLQGGGEDKSDTAMKLAMSIMGYGGRGASPEELALTREDQEALNRYRQGQLEQSGAKGASDIALAQSQMELNKQLQKASIDEALGKTAYQDKQLENERFKARLDMAKTMMGDTNVPIAERMKAWAQFDPAIQQMLTTGAEAANKAEALKRAPEIRALYGKPEQLKTYLSSVPQDILKRPELDWQKWNEELGAEQAKSPSQGAGVIGALWNTPMATQNLIRSGLNVGGKVLLGEQAPEFAYGKYTKPSLEGIDTSQIPAIISQALQLGVPGVGAVGQADVMTQPAPWAGEPPADEYAPGAAFSRQGLPKTQEPGMLDRILATLGLK